MKKTLLASVATLVLLATPALAERHDHSGAPAGNAAAGDHRGGNHGGGHGGGGGNDGGGGHAFSGGHVGGGHGSGRNPATQSPVINTGRSIFSPGGGQGGGAHRSRGGHDNSGFGARTGASNPFAGGRTHAGRGHNSAFDGLRRAFNAPHHYRYGSYHRPSGWYAHRWNYGEFLPSFFFTRSYWINDYSDFDLSDPPPGTVWVRYGDDALLIDEYSGEVIQVVYGIFY